jgi:hypothetical protein
MKVVRLSALRTGLFLLEAESTPVAIVRPEGLCQLKIPVTSSRIEPATFQLVAQCLNQLRHRVPKFLNINFQNSCFREENVKKDILKLDKAG